MTHHTHEERREPTMSHLTVWDSATGRVLFHFPEEFPCKTETFADILNNEHLPDAANREDLRHNASESATPPPRPPTNPLDKSG